MSYLNSRYRSRQAEVDKLKQRQAEPTRYVVHRAVAATWREVRAAVATTRKLGAWLVLRPIMRAPPRDDRWSPPSRDAEPAKRRLGGLLPPRAAPPQPPDPYPYMRTMTDAQLVRRGMQGMPTVERLALEAELNLRGAREYENPPIPDRAELEARLRAEHDAQHGGAGADFDGNLTRH